MLQRSYLERDLVPAPWLPVEDQGEKDDQDADGAHHRHNHQIKSVKVVEVIAEEVAEHQQQETDGNDQAGGNSGAGLGGHQQALGVETLLPHGHRSSSDIGRGVRSILSVFIVLTDVSIGQLLHFVQLVVVHHHQLVGGTEAQDEHGNGHEGVGQKGA